MKVPCTDLRRSYKLYATEYEQAALRVLRSGWYILGNELTDFEREFAEHLGVKYCVGLNSGLDALILAVRALDIGMGDEVIVPANTYIASVLGITENGATPIFVDPDDYMNIDSENIEKTITPHTKAILPVHLYGQACNMERIMDIAKRNNLYVIEDCAQAHGATFKGQMVGTFGNIGCFSFYPTKPIGALGDGGCITTNDSVLAERLRMLRNYGSRKKYINEIAGVNSRLDEIQAAMLRIGLKHLNEGNAMRQNIASRYLRDIDNPRIMFPKTLVGAEHVYHQFPILCRNRDTLQEYLKQAGIQTIIHYPIPPHLAECYRELGYTRGDFPRAESYADTELSLPIYAGMPESDIETVIRMINEFNGV